MIAEDSLVILLMEVEQKYQSWLESPDTLSRIKNLRLAVENYQNALVKDVIC